MGGAAAQGGSEANGAPGLASTATAPPAGRKEHCYVHAAATRALLHCITFGVLLHRITFCVRVGTDTKH